MSQLVRLEGKHSTQNAHCAVQTIQFIQWNLSKIPKYADTDLTVEVCYI